MNETFNTGAPPACEVGMCRKYIEPFTKWQFWNGSFYGFLTSSPEAAFDWFDCDGVFANDDRPWRWATIRELTDAGIPEAEARTMVHESQLPETQEAPWYPPQQEGFGPWIECDGHRPDGLPDESTVARLFRSERACHQYEHDPKEAEYFRGWSSIVAFCIKLDAAAVGAPSTGQSIPCDPGWRDWNAGDAQPPVDRVDIIRVAAGIKGATLTQVDNVPTVSQYWGLGSFVRKWRPAVVAAPVANPNAQMISRDGSAPARGWSDMGSPLIITADFLYSGDDDECPGALTCAPMAYRLGLGRAF